jgi:hypothetical protein
MGSGLVPGVEAGQAPDLAELLSQRAHEVRFADGDWSGPGHAVLLAAARDAQFVVLAEPHNVRQIPAFTLGLLEQLAPLGFRHLALEQGDAILARACEAARERDPAAVAKVAARYPSSFHFSTDQELEAIGRACRSGPADPVWGLDREVAVSHLIDRLDSARLSEPDRTWLESLRARAVDAAAGGDYAREVELASGDTIERLARLFPGENGRDALEALRVFGLYGALQLNASESGADGYLANQLREDWMRRSLMRHYRDAIEAGTEAGGLPRVVVRLGHWHVGRGFGPGGVLTFGNFLHELAHANDLDAYLINVQVVNEPGVFWTITDYPDYDALFGIADPNRSQLVDLRAVRAAVLGGEVQGVNPVMRELIAGYDAILLLAGASRGSWEWRFDAIPATATWSGTLDLGDGSLISIQVRGDVDGGRPRPRAARLPDGTIVTFRDVHDEGSDLVLIAEPAGGGAFDCRLVPSGPGFAGACRGDGAMLTLSLETSAPDNDGGVRQ